MQTMVRWILLGTALLGGVEVWAQGPEASHGRRSRGRDEAGRMVDAYIMSNLQESLELTDEQYVRVLPAIKRLLEERRRLFAERRRLLGMLRQGLGASPVDEKRVATALSELKKTEAEMTDSQRRNIEAVDAALTPIQQARFRVFELEVEQRIRAVLRERRPKGQPVLPPEE